ncbi:MAG TPA: hypothetical protein VGQ84_05335 [Gaiellaceae bacterium]|nr:hypothetical protein [Gaiellaceae bacterium]
MARLANLLLVVFLAAIAVAGLADALRKDGHHGLRGTLYYANAQCRLAAVSLPTLAAVAAPALHACDFAVSPAGSRASSWSIWGGGEPLVASCVGNGVQIDSARGPTLGLIGGCAPAWGPQGELTFVRQGNVVAFPLHGRARVVLPRDWLRRALGLGPEAEAVSAAWTGPRGLAVVVRAGAADDVVALFAGTRLVASARPGGRLGRVTSRGDGGALLVERADHGAVVLLDSRLRLLATRNARAAAWSPDGRRLAVATGDRVLVVDASSGRSVAPPLELDAVALAWR